MNRPLTKFNNMITSDNKMNSYFLKILSLFLGITFFTSCQVNHLQAQSQAQYDLVIAGGTVIDPETNLYAVKNIGIRNGKIIDITSVLIKGKETINVSGLVVAPGFIDMHVHDTYFVIAHFHLVMGVASMFGMFAGIYHWYPKMFGRFMNNTLAYIHFWITMIGAYLIFWPMHYEGIAGMPRRYYDFSNWESFKMFHGLNQFISIVAIIVFFVQFLFIFNFFYSMFKGRKVTEKTNNPWHSTTLEWTTPVNPGHGNWEGEIPEVHRWAYDYSKGDRDFIPQTEPISADEAEH